MRRTILVLLGLALITLVVYGQSGRFDFLVLDDQIYVTNNYFVRQGLTPESLKWAFTTGHASNWHPLTWCSLLLDATLYDNWPGGYHLQNVAWHIAATCLLYLALVALTGREAASALVAALFALHPLHIESVAWIAERKDVLSAAFGFLSLYVYARYARTPTPLLYAMLMLTFVLSLLAKQMLVTFPFVLLLLDYWPLGRMRIGKDPARGGIALPGVPLGQLILEKIPLLGISLAACAAVLWARQFGDPTQLAERFAFGDRLANAVLSYGIYLRRLVWPTDLCIFYPHPGSAISPSQVAVAAACLLAITLVCLWQARRRPYLLVGWLWFLGTLVPVLGLVQDGNQAMADRYTYIPLVGLFMMFSFGLADLATARPAWRWATAALGILAVTACGVFTARELSYWRDSKVLLDHLLAKQPENWLLQQAYGGLLFSEGRYPEAAERFREVIRLRPTIADGYINLATTLDRAHQLGPARVALEQALAVDPKNLTSRLSMALKKSEAGKTNEAMHDLESILEDEPRVPAAHLQLGLLQIRSGEKKLGLIHLRQAVELVPTKSQYRVILAKSLAEQGQAAEALDQYREALRYDPKLAIGWIALAQLLVEQGRFQEAESQFRAGLAQTNNDPDLQKAFADTMTKVHRKLGDEALGNNQPEEALKQYRAWLELDPNTAEVYARLGTALAKAGQFDDAVLQYRAAIQKRKDPATLCALAAVLLEQKKNDEAIKTLDEALRLEPARVPSRLARALAFQRLGKTAEAMAEYRAILKLDPAAVAIANDLAWILATNPNDRLRNGAEAVRLLDKIPREGSEAQPEFLDTLAAAYAEAGDFPKAMAVARQAADAAKNAGQTDLVKDIESRLATYRQKRPFRDAGKRPGS